MNTLYETLGVSRKCNDKDIAKAYRKAVRKYHPDANAAGDDEAKAKYDAAVLAYEVLSDYDRRAKYDATGETTEARINSAVAEIMQVLGPVFFGVIEQTTLGGFGDVKTKDVIRTMRDVIEKNKKNLKEAIRKSEKVRLAILEAARRLSIKEVDGEKKEDFLSAAAKSQVPIMEHREKMMKAELEKFDRALKYLEAYQYHTDAFGGFGLGSSSATSGFFSSWR